MTQEDKNLLMLDLCARLPYGAKIYYKTDGWEDKNHTLTPQVIDNLLIRRDVVIKPYLRPMESMTEEEKKHFDNFICLDEDAWTGKSIKGYINQSIIMSNGIDWLNKNMFDFRGLIPNGSAIEVTKDNNPYKL